MILFRLKNKNNTKIKGYFLILYQGLKPNAIYWEFVNTLRKFLVLCFLLFTRNIAINLSLIMLALSARIEVGIKPYKNHEHYKSEFLAIMAGICTIMAALIFSQEDQNSNFNFFVLLTILMVNLKFLMEWTFLLI